MKKIILTALAAAAIHVTCAQAGEIKAIPHSDLYADPCDIRIVEERIVYTNDYHVPEPQNGKGVDNFTYAIDLYMAGRDKPFTVFDGYTENGAQEAIKNIVNFRNSAECRPLLVSVKDERLEQRVKQQYLINEAIKKAWKENKGK
ncbi:exported hypothetical protein [Candidatus Terasakiella magnetica]|uniref:Uncharacterized protein n=1 Tax=Candidatus Terasakiella magnetica TaxID=1867952 RepID=A0A1C3RLI9_9PROT|nr:hypothetical protein [Candidatus Terasakiella magnetica]SCA58111.1 exported hypothetical protein [Candidatus Terasakiella magnetica]